MGPKQKKRLMWQVPFLVLLIVGTILIIRQQQNPPYQHNTGSIFGTVYSITYQHADDLHADIRAKLQEVDNALSMFNEKSVISQINNGQRAIPKTTEGDMFVEVYKLARQISADTDGAFDITVAPLVNAWGFGFKHDEMPSQAQVDSLLQFVGYDKVAYTTDRGGRNIDKSDPRVMLDCSAIAKGYGVDMVARLLDSKGVQNYLVEIGGEVVTKGISQKRLPWKIGVTKPTEEAATGNGELQTVLNVTDKAMATSGNYRNFYYKGGRRYAPTIDPKTGCPVQHNILSATVLADSCARADAYATSFMVMGLQKTKQVLASHPELMVYLIYDDEGKNAVWYSPSLKDKIEK
ncbi:MAG: FAD:protein FMN transferase [Prevotella sp.]|nr:FAD:protein FMN transferase [Prevotella sp.]